MVDPSENIMRVLKLMGAYFVVSVPCVKYARLIRLIDESRMINHVPATREEEGVGICAGAALAGQKIPILLIQNSGLGNSVNALMSLTELFHLPLVMFISHRGTKGEKMTAQVPMGRITSDLLYVMGIEHKTIEGEWGMDDLAELIGTTYQKRRITAALFPIDFWEDDEKIL